MATIITITLKTPAEVRQELGEKLSPEVVRGLEITTTGTDKPNPWVWVKGTKRGDKETSATLREIGFKWSPRREAWYHTCETDITKRSWGKGRKKSTGSTGATRPASPARTRYSPTPDNTIDDEFARRFQLR